MKNVMLLLRELLSENPTEVLQTKKPGQLICHPGSYLFFLILPAELPLQLSTASRAQYLPVPCQRYLPAQTFVLQVNDDASSCMHVAFFVHFVHLSSNDGSTHLANLQAFSPNTLSF